MLEEVTSALWMWLLHPLVSLVSLATSHHHTFESQRTKDHRMSPVGKDPPGSPSPWCGQLDVFGSILAWWGAMGWGMDVTHSPKKVKNKVAGWRA